MRTLIFTLIVSSLCGCGYQFQGVGSILPPDVKTVYIPISENNSTEASFSTLLTESLRDRFERFGVVSVLDSQEGADAILRTKILKVGQDSQSVTSKTDVALQMNANVTIWGELKRPNGQVLWRDPKLVVGKAFGSTSDSVVTSSADFASGGIGAGDLGGLSSREVSRGQEQETYANLAEQAARIIYDQAVAPDF